MCVGADACSVITLQDKPSHSPEGKSPEHKKDDAKVPKPQAPEGNQGVYEHKPRDYKAPEHDQRDYYKPEYDTPEYQKGDDYRPPEYNIPESKRPDYYRTKDEAPPGYRPPYGYKDRDDYYRFSGNCMLDSACFVAKLASAL